jgi:hypothetical protein
MTRKLRPQEMRERTRNILPLVEELSPGVEVLSSITDELLHQLPQQCQEASRLTEILVHIEDISLYVRTCARYV